MFVDVGSMLACKLVIVIGNPRLRRPHLTPLLVFGRSAEVDLPDMISRAQFHSSICIPGNAAWSAEND
jgi:hypothetical protein